MKVLLVEENSALRGLIRRLVALPGIWIQECATGANAVAAYAVGPADIVIVDLDGKDPSGITACEQIKSMDAAVRIIVVSDYDDAGLRASAQRAGACGYVLKDNLMELPKLLKELSATV